MKYDHALEYFGSVKALASAARVTRQSVFLWKKSGVVAKASADRLEQISAGGLKVDPTLYQQDISPDLYRAAEFLYSQGMVTGKQYIDIKRKISHLSVLRGWHPPPAAPRKEMV